VQNLRALDQYPLILMLYSSIPSLHVDPRATRLADVFLHHSLNLKKGEKLVISASDLYPLELLQECFRLAVEDGAFVEMDIMGLQMERGRSTTGGFLRTLLEKGNDDQIRHVSPILDAKIEWGDKFLFISTVHDDLFLADIDQAKVAAWRAARFPTTKKVMGRTWVLTQFPTPNLAERAGMSYEKFIDFYYDACLVDYNEEAKRLQKLQDILDAGKEVHIVGPGTDLRLGIEGRLAAGVENGKYNVPDGECFLAPLENKVNGVVTFELPQMREGNVAKGVRFEFKDGRIENATAEEGEEFLLHVLDDHPGNRRLGELGIGMNRMITKYIQNILFDEKIEGTVHMAIGQAYPHERGGGKNEGSTHWDLIKDLRFPGTFVKVDDRVIMQDGQLTL
jgi:aminopeptidase